MEHTKTQRQTAAGPRRTLNGKILRSTVSLLAVLVVFCCAVMMASMTRLTNNLLMDNMQPLARQSAKTLEANIHLLADRLLAIADEDALTNPAATPDQRSAVLEHARKVYELHSIALYGPDGLLMQGEGAASLDSSFLSLLQETDNLTTSTSTVSQGELGITMGMPVKQAASTNPEESVSTSVSTEAELFEEMAKEVTAFYVVAVYTYDALNDVLQDIHIGQSGQATIVSRKGQIVGSLDQSEVLVGSSLAALRSDGYAQVIERLTGGETGAVEVSGEHGKMFLAFSPIRGTQWTLLIEIPKSDYAVLTNQAIGSTVIAAVLLLLLAIILTVRLSRSISTPIRKTVGRMVDLANGNLHDPVETVLSGDELELLTGTLETTASSINHYISEIDRVLGQIASGNLDVAPEGAYEGDFHLLRDSLSNIIGSMNETMRDFQTAAFELHAISAQLNQQSSQLHQASAEQSQSAGQLVDEVSLVRTQLEQVSGSATQTREKTSQISQMLQNAEEQMDALTQAMSRINANAQEIARLANVIGDIASQTNILAVNASIEAARAGTAGKGFAVVAGEVQKLAAMSAETAKNATNMAANPNEIVQEGVDLTTGTAQFIEDIFTASREINAITKTLFDAVEEQAVSLHTMEQRIETISSIAERNRYSAEESERSSSTLSEQADRLQQQVCQFVLKRGEIES